ncbi:MAG: helix-turn-helix domain-containing protein, partial [Chloroflexota bacterium]|nr:helix-turn-helix domain-containing protein [Chloroflexota bacterium]
MATSPETTPRRPSEVQAERAYYSISQAAAALGVSRVSIWRWINAGQLPVARLGHRTARIAREDLERLVHERAAEGGDRRGREARRLVFDPFARVAPSDHVAQFYESEQALISSAARFIGAALRNDEAALVVATDAHQAAIMD